MPFSSHSGSASWAGCSFSSTGWAAAATARNAKGGPNKVRPRCRVRVRTDSGLRGTRPTSDFPLTSTFDVRPSKLAKHVQQPRHRIVVPADDALFQRNDPVVRDVDVLGADLRAALGDVAVTHPRVLLHVRDAVGRVDRVHLELRRVDEVARSDELVEFGVLAQHVADVLAEEALD